MDSFPGRTFTGEVVQIRKAPQVVQNVVTYDVVVTAKNPEQRLLPGMTANVRIVIDQKESVLQVPNAALRFRPAGVEADRSASGRRGPAAGPAAAAAAAAGAPGRARVGASAPTASRPRSPLQLGISDGTYTEVRRAASSRKARR